MLSDRSIREMINKGCIGIDPFPEDPQFQPASIDLRLDAVMDGDGYLFADQPEEGYNFYMIQPGQFMLGSTAERVQLRQNVVGQVHGKSTLARSGLIVHAAGLVDPGFQGQLTLEMFNMSRVPIHLKHDMVICQITFELLSSAPDRLYGHPGLFSKYQGQTGPTAARTR